MAKVQLELDVFFAVLHGFNRIQKCAELEEKAPSVPLMLKFPDFKSDDCFYNFEHKNPGAVTLNNDFYYVLIKGSSMHEANSISVTF